MAHGYIWGHEIECRDGAWIYIDNGEQVSGIQRVCGKCGEQPTPEGHDACLGTLPRVMNACCGHGTGQPYVQYPCLILRGGKAAREIERLRDGYYLRL